MSMRPIATIASRRVFLGLTVSALSASAFAQTPVAQAPPAPVPPRTALLRGKPGQNADLNSVKVLREFALRSLMEYNKAKAANPNAVKNSPEASRQRLLRKTRDRLGGFLQDRAIRAYPLDKIDKDTYVKAVSQRDQLAPTPQTVLGGSVSSASNKVQAVARVVIGPELPAENTIGWESVGPYNMTADNSWAFGPGSVSGRVNGLAYDATNTQVAYLVSPTGGLWKTTDNGNQWTPLGDRWEKMDANCVATHPTDGRTVFVGLGDYNGLNGLFGTGGNGIRRSQDGGLTWSIRTPNLTDQLVSNIVVDKSNPQVVMATTGRGQSLGYLLRSTNGGDSFAQATGFPNGWNGRGHWSDIEASAAPGGGGIYFATCNYSGAGRDGLYYSFNRGASWAQIPTPPQMINLDWEYAGFRVAPSPTNPKVVYLVRGEDNWDYQVFRGTLTTSATGEFTSVVWQDVTTTLQSYRWSQLTYNLWAQAIPLTRNTANGPVSTDLLFSATLGVTGLYNPSPSALWRDISQTYTGSDIFHTDQHAFAPNPNNPTEMLVGNDGGVYRVRVDTTDFQRSGSGDSLTYFTDASLNKSLAITEFYRADWHPSNPDRMIGGTQDNSTPVSLGDTLNWRAVIGGDGSACAIDQINPNIQFGGTQYTQGFYRTTDSWTTAQDVSIFNSPFRALAIAEYNAGQVPFVPQMALTTGTSGAAYLGTRYLWRWNPSTTPGQPATWTPQIGNQPLAGTGQYVVAIAVAPSDPNRIYTGSVDGQLWMTANGGATWRRLNPNGAGFPVASITSIAVHPNQPNRITFTLGGGARTHVWGSANTDAPSLAFANRSGTGGAPLPDITANAIALDYSDPTNKMYVGTDVGVFATTDGGSTWTNMTAPLGLPNVRVSTLKAVPGTGYLNAATFGRGMWRIRIGAIQDAIPVGTTVTASRLGSTLTVNARLQNTSTYMFTALTVTGAALSFTDAGGLDARRTSTTAMPLRIGTVPAGTSTTRPLVFDVTSIAPGTQATVLINGTVTVGRDTRPFIKQISVRIP